MKIKVSDYVISWLENKNIDTVFTVSGGGSIILCDSLRNSDKINYVCCHHEQGVVFAAEGYSRTNKEIGVGLVTTGPGGTNVLTGLAAAWIDSVPLMIISGQVFLSQTIGKTGARQIGVQETNIVDLAKPTTKYAIMVEDGNNIHEILEEAYYTATSGRKGPVLIDIPADIQNQIVEINPSSKNLNSYLTLKNPLVKEEEIDIVIDKMISSKRPIIHLGHGVKFVKDLNLFFNFLDMHNIPIMTTWNATDIIPSSNRLFVGRPGAFAERGANFNIQNCDFYLSIGTRLPFMVTGYNTKDFARNAYKIMVDIDKSELEKNRCFIDLLIHSHSNDFVKALMQKIPNTYKSKNNWLETCQKTRNKYPIILSHFVEQERYVYSYYFIDILSKHLSNNSTVITDMGLSFVGTHQAFKVKDKQIVCTNSGHAPMGWGLPAAIGSYFSDTSKAIICLTGEGGLMMNIQELATVMHHKIPMKIFIYNNGGYQTIKDTQILGFQGRLMGCNEESGISFPDFKNIAKSFNIKYLKIENNKDLDNKINNILNENQTFMIELMIDPDQQHIPKAVNRRDGSGKVLASNYEDLYPHLSFEEIKENLV